MFRIRFYSQFNMASFKLVVSDPDSGKSENYELKDQQAQVFVGLKIGETVDASVVGAQGKVKITGGRDKAGFPMRSDVSGGVKKYALLTKGTGLRSKKKGNRKRKLVRGHTITDEIYQINTVLAK